MQATSAFEFEKIVSNLLVLEGFKLIEESSSNGYDFTAFKNNRIYYIECKYYRSKIVSFKIIQNVVFKLAVSIQKSNGEHVARLYLSNVMSSHEKMSAYEIYGVEIWDRNDIQSKLETLSLQLNSNFEKILLETQQGLDTDPVFSNKSPIPVDKSEQNKFQDPIGIVLPQTKGTNLITELNNIVCGKSQWGKYEKKCIKILKYLFEDDLALWEPQNRTEDGLSRFDLICRIASKDDFWKSLISSFNTRFILFEFKNYCTPIGADQIYTTERYLFIKALRSVGFVIARNGGDKNAIQAAKGALKEHGKLIIILSDQDLINMLISKDTGGNPGDYLADILDKWLISLSR
ncbi:restriction endonuclease [Sphingobacterium sp.]|uniref:restriction endonuclease n=1 Tax=Sphingobacterium sp. TaxID=341027 RepID=UPI0031D75414